MLGSSQHSSSSDRVDITVTPLKLKCLINNERDHTLSSNVTLDSAITVYALLLLCHPLIHIWAWDIAFWLILYILVECQLQCPIVAVRRWEKEQRSIKEMDARSVTKSNVSQDWPWISRRGETLLQWILQCLNMQKVRWMTNVQVAYRCPRERSDSGWCKGTAMHKSHMRRHL